MRAGCSGGGWGFAADVAAAGILSALTLIGGVIVIVSDPAPAWAYVALGTLVLWQIARRRALAGMASAGTDDQTPPPSRTLHVERAR